METPHPIAEYESVSEWIEGMKRGDSAAKRQLWERYYMKLIGTAQAIFKQRAKGREAFDEEDVLQSVFANLFVRAQNDKFPELTDRHGLWRLLIVMTERRVIAKVRDANVKKRGGGVKHLPVHGGRSGRGSQLVLNVPDRPEPLPQTTEELINTIEAVLGDCGTLEKEIALHRMQGFEIAEIADKVGRSRATVQRKIGYLKERLREAM